MTICQMTKCDVFLCFLIFSNSGNHRHKTQNAQESAPFASPLAQNKNSILEDLRRLNQLKDSVYDQDLSKA